MKLSSPTTQPSPLFHHFYSLRFFRFSRRPSLLFLLLFCDFLALLYGLSTLSIGADEARIFYAWDEDFNFNLSSGSGRELGIFVLSFFCRAGVFLLGQNDLGLRFFWLLFHLFSAILIFILAKKYVRKEGDALFATALFILLPGTVASALLVNSAALVILLSLALLCAYEYEKKYIFYPLFALSSLASESFEILFLAFLFFALFKQNWLLAALSATLFCLNFYLFGFDISGRPSGHFLDTIAIFSACFSPLIFIYFFYVIYRLIFENKKSLLWFLMISTFLFCCIFSLRQKIYLENFLPFCVISTPLLVSIFMASYRVRLPQFRMRYSIFLHSALIFLFCSYLLFVGNYFLYFMLKKPEDNFANKYHFAREFSEELKKMDIYKIRVAPSLQERIKFYGIDNSNELYLKSIKNAKDLDEKKKKIIVKMGRLKRYFQVEKF